MNCRECRDVADSFLSDELLTETNHEVLQHLDGCVSCRAEIGVRRELRRSLRTAFDHAVDLQPPSDFATRLRAQLRTAAADERQDRRPSHPWLMLAAGLVFAAVLAMIIVVTEPSAPVDALSRDAVGDHWYCALKHRRGLRMAVSLEEGQRFDRAYRVLLTAPPDEISTPRGPARVVARHACAFGKRRFGHVILQYQQHVVSLLVTADEPPAGGSVTSSDQSPRLHGGPVSGLSVASIRTTRHAILLVSDLEGSELIDLSRTVSVPLAEQLANGLSGHGFEPLAELHLDEALGRLVSSGS